MFAKKTILALLLAMVALLFMTGLIMGAIPQPEAYHNFADNRTWLGMPNVWNVLSNIPFALAGIWGLVLLFSSGKVQFVDNRERILWIGVSIGLILTAIGSGYYHLAPNNSRLVWDRLPMTIIFMSYVAALISDRISIRVGFWLWPILLAAGFYSIIQWHVTELHGMSDLRYYLSVQAFTISATLIMLFAPSHYDRNGDLFIVVCLFGLARFFEIYDHQFWMFTDGIISGHTLKHLAAAMAGFWLIRMISNRKIVDKNFQEEY